MSGIDPVIYTGISSDNSLTGPIDSFPIDTFFPGFSNQIRPLMIYMSPGLNGSSPTEVILTGLLNFTYGMINDIIKDPIGINALIDSINSGSPADIALAAINVILSIIPIPGERVAVEAEYIAIKAETRGAINAETRGATKTTMGSCFSFTAGTQVALPDDKFKSIENIEEGDFVLAYDEINKKVTQSKVLKTHNRISDQIIIIHTDEEIIKTTPEHPFFMRSKWVKAENIVEGDYLTNDEMSEIKVTKVTKKSNSFPVYNFSVENYYNYFVSNDSVLVHNPCNGSTKRPGFRSSTKKVVMAGATLNGRVRSAVGGSGAAAAHDVTESGYIRGGRRGADIDHIITFSRFRDFMIGHPRELFSREDLITIYNRTDNLRVLSRAQNRSHRFEVVATNREVRALISRALGGRTIT